MASGIEMLMRSVGVDPDEIKNSVEGFMQMMKAAVDQINENQKRLEAKLDTILIRLEPTPPRPRPIEGLDYKGNTTEILHQGQPTGILVTDEKFPDAVISEANGKAAIP